MKRILFVAAAASVLFSASNGRAALLAHWAFDETSGPTAFDSAGSLDGTLAGGAAFAPGAGVAGGAIDLDSTTGDLVNMGNVLSLTGTDFSISLWVKTIDTSADNFPVAKHVAGSFNGYFFNINTTGGDYGVTTRAMFYTSSAPGSEVVSTTSVTDGEWHNIVGVYRSGISKEIYVDGLPLESGGVAEALVANSAPFLVGGLQSSGTPTAFYNGLIDELRVYDHALSNPEIEGLFDCPTNPDLPHTCTLDRFLCYKTKMNKSNVCGADSVSNAGATCINEANCGGVDDVTEYCRKNAIPKGVVANLETAFETRDYEIKPPPALCNPAASGADPILDADTHLRGYGLKLTAEPPQEPHEPQTLLHVENELGQLFLDTIKFDRLLVPASKSLLGPIAAPDAANHKVEHFLCYKVKGSKTFAKFPGVAGFQLDDQFTDGTKLFDLKKPKRLCLAADKNGEGVSQPEAVLVCYTAKAGKDQPKHAAVAGIYVNDQFGPALMDTVKEAEVCLPSFIHDHPH